MITDRINPDTIPSAIAPATRLGSPLPVSIIGNSCVMKITTDKVEKKRKTISGIANRFRFIPEITTGRGVRAGSQKRRVSKIYSCSLSHFSSQ